MAWIACWLWVALAWAGPRVQPADVATFEDDIRPVVEEALSALEAGRFEDAARQLGALAEAGADPDLDYLYVLALYEGGDLRRADRASERVIEGAGDHGPLLNLRGLILADLGRGDEAEGVLQRAATRAKAVGDTGLRARVALNTGLIALDRGALNEATRQFREAARLGEQAGDARVVEQAEVNSSVVGSLRGEQGADDVVGRIVDRVREGDLDGARELVPDDVPPGRRDAIQARVARAVVARAEGRFDAAAVALQQALLLAREGGLVRQRVRVLGELALAHRLAGRDLLAREHLREALDLVEGTHFRVEALDLHGLAGLVEVDLGDPDAAAGHLEAGRRLARTVESSMGAVRLHELEGALAAARGDVEAAAAAWQEALGVVEQHPADAARIGTALVRLYAGREPEQAEAWAERARAAFEQAGNPLGPTHVLLAEAEGLVREGRIDEALEGFQAAAEQAQGAGSPRGELIAEVARARAVEALHALGHSEGVAARAAKLGLEETMARQEVLSRARQAWREGMKAWEAGDYDTARARFDTAYMGFRELGEAGYARTARRGRAWALWNHAVGGEPSAVFPWYEEIVQEAIQVDDPELRVRARAAKALAGMEIQGVDAGPLLEECAEDAASIGMDDLASRCWSGLAERGDDLDVRARAARQAHLLDPGAGDASYAMYSVAVDAYNADRYELAVELAQEVLPVAGELEDPVTAVLEAARRAE